jgi:diguanylate cyclase (GGDEF)-like protein/PAS domain S-box-containing protein
MMNLTMTGGLKRAVDAVGKPVSKPLDGGPTSGAVNPPGRLSGHLLLSIASLLLYLLLNLPSAEMFWKLGSTGWYPANGLLMALMLGVSPWYAVLGAVSGALAGLVIYHQPLGSFSEIPCAVGVAGIYGLAACVLRGPLRIDLNLTRGRDISRYVWVTACAALASTLIGVACLVADKTIPWSAFWKTARGWFVGDETGLLGLAPFLLIHAVPWVRTMLAGAGSTPVASGRHPEAALWDVRKVGFLLPEALGQAMCLLAALWIMFWPPFGHLIFMSFVPVLWMAMRQGVQRVSTGIVAMNFGIALAIHRFPPPQIVVDRIGLLMLVVSAAGLIVGSTVTDRHLVDADLRERTAYLRSLIENSPLGIVVLSREGRVEIANEVFARLFLFASEEELMGSTLHDLFPAAEGCDGEQSRWSEQVVSGQSLRRVVRRKRRDGKTLDLDIQAVPLVVDGRVRGAYAICQDISEHVKASEASREHAAALNLLVKELEVQTDQMTLLDEMGTLLQCCATIEEACTVTKTLTRKLFPEAVAGSFHTFRASRNLVETAVSWGDMERPPSTFGPDACWSLRRGQAHWSDPAEGGILCEHLESMLAARYLCVPMMGQGETLGVLTLGFPGKTGDLSSWMFSRQQLAAAVGGQVARALASLRLRETLRDQSVRDPLTRLFNRRFMEESLEKEISRAERKDRPLSVLFLDIDHFKQFNDTYGHEAGDFVLQAVADLLLRVFRKDDVACRCGGEEFAVIMPESLSEPAVARANVLRAEVKNLKLRYRDVLLAPISLSVGVATFPEHCSTPEDLLRMADQCLYQSKEAGRDRVTVARAARSAANG